VAKTGRQSQPALVVELERCHGRDLSEMLRAGGEHLTHLDRHPLS
jgi:hypothetical protein